MSKQAAPSGESPEARFKRVAGLRVANVIEAIRKLHALGNRQIYAYNASQLEKMFEGMENALTEARDAMEGIKPKPRMHFEL